MQPSHETRYRPFDPDRDAEHLLRNQVLQRGEQIRWTSAEGIRYYEVTGREPNGDKSSRGSAWTRPLKHSLKVVFYPVTLLLAVWMVDATFPSGTREDNIPFTWGSRKPPPESIVFGSEPDSMAVLDPRGPTPGRGDGLWLLTDRRFARLTFEYVVPEGDRDRHLDPTDPNLPTEPMKLRIDLDIPAAKIHHEQGRERRLPGRFKPRTATYCRFTLPDGSGFDIRESEDGSDGQVVEVIN